MNAALTCSRSSSAFTASRATLGGMVTWTARHGTTSQQPCMQSLLPTCSLTATARACLHMNASPHAKSATDMRVL